MSIKLVVNEKSIHAGLALPEGEKVFLNENLCKS